MHTEIDKKLVREERIKTKLMDISFKAFNANRTKNRKVTRYTPLEVKINRHTERINAVVTDLNETDIFLGYN